MNAELPWLDLPELRPHPARYPERFIPIIAAMLADGTRILDPFGECDGIFARHTYLPDAQIEAAEVTTLDSSESTRLTMELNTTASLSIVERAILDQEALEAHRVGSPA